MASKITCDRCGKSIEGSDERILDLLKDEYPGKDICPDCDIQIKIASQCAKEDALGQHPPGTTLRNWINLYK